MVSAAWYCCHYLPTVSTTPVANLPPVSTTLAKMEEKFATGVADTGGKFATAVVDTGGNFAAGGVDTGGKFATGGAPWLANISANFRKKSKRSKWNTLGLGGNWFIKKTRSKKSCDTVPLSELSFIYVLTLLPKDVQTKYFKLFFFVFSFILFLHVPPVSMILVVLLKLRIFPFEFSKKFETAQMEYSPAGGKLIHEKTWNRKSRGTVSLTYK